MTERGLPDNERTPIRPGHICLLFRRFKSYAEDVTRPYVEALEAREVPHLLVGGKSFHSREEIETMRAALAAIEWPDDELSVFAALRGPLFAFTDIDLLEYRRRYRRLHPFRLPSEPADERLASITNALRLLQSLHRRRNYRPAAETLARLLDATRACAGFALRHSGEQALANVLHIAELARQYDASGGISFRGFVERLEETDAQFDRGRLRGRRHGYGSDRLHGEHENDQPADHAKAQLPNTNRLQREGEPPPPHA